MMIGWCGICVYKARETWVSIVVLCSCMAQYSPFEVRGIHPIVSPSDL